MSESKSFEAAKEIFLQWLHEQYDALPWWKRVWYRRNAWVIREGRRELLREDP